MTLHRSPVGPRRAGRRLLRGRVGALRHDAPTGRRPTTCRRSTPRSWPSCSSCSLIEAVRHNVLPLDDRAAERMNPAIAGRPDASSQGDIAAAVPGHDPPQRERRDQRQEPVVLRSPPRSTSPTAGPTARSSPRAAAPAAGASSRPSGKLGLPLQLLRAAARRRSRPTSRCRQAPTRSAPSSPTTAAASAAAARSPSTSTGRGRQRACRTHPPAVLLLRRRPRPRRGHAACRSSRATRRRGPVHRDDRLGPDRPRRRRPQPPDRPRTTSRRRCCISSRHG